MTRRSETLHFVVSGPLDQATGGYRYDAAIIAGLRAQGYDVRVHELAGRFPHVDATARQAARQALVTIGKAHVVIDGLALPAFRGALNDRMVGLVHHPLWMETGLASNTAATLRALEEEMLPRLKRIVVTSRVTKRDVAALGVAQDRIAVIEPGTARGAPRSRRSRGAPRLLCVAALTPRKAHDVLLRALHGVKHPWRLLCVGGARDALYARRVRTMAKGKRAYFYGEAPWSALTRFYRQADLFVLPSLHEGYGMAFTEALARGTPVVAARAGAVPDVIPKTAGVLVPPGDVRALARVLRRLVRNARARARLARGAYLSRRRFPDWPEQARAFGRVLAT